MTPKVQFHDNGGGSLGKPFVSVNLSAEEWDRFVEEALPYLAADDPLRSGRRDLIYLGRVQVFSTEAMERAIPKVGA